MEPFVHSINHNGLGIIEFFSEKSNALPLSILEQIANAVSAADADPNVKVILLKSGGEKAFCAGASFEELASIHDQASGLKFFSGFAEVILRIRAAGKIVIGRIHGKAVGGGVGLAAACDYALATRYASVRLSELAVGIGPFVIGPAVERKIGLAAFSQMALSPTEWQSAEWAKQRGLYQEAFESTQQLDEYIVYFTSQLMQYNPQALTALKEVFWQGTGHWPALLKERAAISGSLVLSNFTREAISRFS
ncbi:MAG: enoyl-CoA hydratase/isomerase family protein [Saprospiraceae bacterium]